MLIHEKLPYGQIYPQLTQFPTTSADFLAVVRGGQTVDSNNLLTTADTIQTNMYKTALASGHLTKKGKSHRAGTRRHAYGSCTSSLPRVKKREHLPK